MRYIGKLHRLRNREHEMKIDSVKMYRFDLFSLPLLAMRRALIYSFVVSVFPQASFGQVDSSAQSFFPSKVGDAWHYRYTQTSGYVMTITRDSIADGSRFLFVDSSSAPSYLIDSTLKVFQFTTNGKLFACLYDLDARLGETWISQDTTSGAP